MPGLDHEVHPSVCIGPEHRYGCWQRDEHKAGYLAPNRIYTSTGNYILEKKYVEHRMSRECRFDMSLSDPACEGCHRRGTGEEYDRMVRSLGT